MQDDISRGNVYEGEIVSVLSAQVFCEFKTVLNIKSINSL